MTKVKSRQISEGITKGSGRFRVSTHSWQGAIPAIFFAVALAAFPRPGFAQDQDDQVQQDTSRIRQRVLELAARFEEEDEGTSGETETAEFEPLFGGLRSGASIAGGIRFIPVENDRFLSAIDLQASIRKYYGVGALIGYEWGRFMSYAYGQYRHMPEEDFYGIGSDVTEAGRSDYRLNDVLAGVQLGFRPFEHSLAGVHASYFANRFGPGRDGDQPNIDMIYDPLNVPALGLDTEYGLFGVWLEYDTRQLGYEASFGSRFAPTRHRIRSISYTATRGIYATAEVRRYQQVGGAGFSFTEAEAELQQFLPIAGGDHVLAFREYGIFTSPDAGEEVPFYLMPSLGGTRTLRGYLTYVFRDRNALLANVEYRWNGWRYVQPAFFVDAGYVFRSLEHLDIQDPEADVGVSLRLILRSHVVLRGVLAYGEEGLRHYIRVGYSR